MFPNSCIVVSRASAEVLARALMRTEFYFAAAAAGVDAADVERPPLFEPGREQLADGPMQAIFGDIAAALAAWYDAETDAEGLVLYQRADVAPRVRRLLERDARSYAGHKLAAALLAPSSPRAAARHHDEAQRRMDSLLSAAVAIPF